MLLNETEYSSGSGEVSHDTDVVCVAVIEKMDLFSGFFHGNVVYHCCGKSEQASVWQASSIECELVAGSSRWFKAFSGTLNILTVVMMFYCSALLLAIPAAIFNLRGEYDKEIQRVKRAREQCQQAQDRRLNSRSSGHGSINQNQVQVTQSLNYLLFCQEKMDQFRTRHVMVLSAWTVIVAVPSKVINKLIVL